MTFKDDKVNEFLEIFKAASPKIKEFKGCNGVKLLQDKKDRTVFFTYSYWDDDESLNNYRTSDLFHKTWIATKELFKEKAEAWSTTEK